MTAKAICEHLVLVPGPHQFALFITMPYAPTPPSFTLHLFLDFAVFPSKIYRTGLGPSIFVSASNPAKSRYPAWNPRFGSDFKNFDSLLQIQIKV